MAPNIHGYETIDRYAHPVYQQYLASHRTSGETVIITSIPVPEQITNHDVFIGVMRRLKAIKLPGISQVIDAGVTADGYYVVNQFSGQPTLQARIESGLTIEQAKIISLNLAKILDELGIAGHILPSLHPSNVFVDEQGNPTLTNLLFDDLLAQLGLPVKTDWHYANPELIKGEAPSTVGTYFSLGVILYQMVTHSLPFDGEDDLAIKRSQLQDTPKALASDQATQLPALKGLLRKSANKRIHNAHALEQSFALGGGIPTAESPAPDIPVATSEPVPPTIDDLEQTDQDPLDQEAPALVAEKRERSGSRETNQTTNDETKSSKTPIIAALLVLVLGGGAAAIGFAPQLLPGNPLAMQLHTQAMEMLGLSQPKPGTPPPPPKPAIDPMVAKITALLQQADQHMQAEAFLAPADNNAFVVYQAVLEIDTENLAANKGIEQITAKLTFMALTAIENDDLALARQYISDLDSMGQFAKSTDNLKELLAQRQALLSQQEEQNAAEAARLAELEKQKQREAQRRAAAKAKQEEEARKARELALVKAQEEAEARAAAEAEKQKADALFTKVKINGLMAKANTYYQRGDYYSPAQNNALEKYLEVLSLDANNTAAAEGVGKIVEHMLPEIEKHLQNQQISMARNLFEQAYGAAPNHPKLFDLSVQQGWTRAETANTQEM